MKLKNAALFALVGMILLTVLQAAGFIRNLMGLAQGTVAVLALLTSAIHLLASLSLSVFLYVFYDAQA